MKLWIRTADNRGLYEVCGIRVEGVDVQTYDIIGFFNSKQVILGEYDTFNRCLEIIDEIQELLKLGNPENAFYNITNCEMPSDQLAELFKRVRKDKAIVTRDVDFEVIMPNVITYQMPEE